MANDFVTRAQYDELVDVVETLVEKTETIQACNAELKTELEVVEAKNVELTNVTTALREELTAEVAARQVAEARLEGLLAEREEQLARLGPNTWTFVDPPIEVFQLSMPQGRVESEIVLQFASCGSFVSGYVQGGHTPQGTWDASVRMTSKNSNGELYDESGFAAYNAIKGNKGWESGDDGSSSFYFSLRTSPDLDVPSICLITDSTLAGHRSLQVFVTRYGV